MISIEIFRTDPARIISSLINRGIDSVLAHVTVQAVIDTDIRIRSRQTNLQALKSIINAKSKFIGSLIKGGISKDSEEVTSLMSESSDLSYKLAHFNDTIPVLDSPEYLNLLMLKIPNLCDSVAPKGCGSEDNEVVLIYGVTPEFSFKPKAHWDIGTDLNIIDFDRTTKMSGEGFVSLRGIGARLSRALISWFLDIHTANGYTELAVPYLVNSKTMTGTGQLPKFADQLYKCESAGLYLIPTAEVPVTNFHSGEILKDTELPILYTAHTPCFRSEAGAAGIGTRGMTRVHQFDKVELVCLCKPEDSSAYLLKLCDQVEVLLDLLGLHYRLLHLCTSDLGFSSSDTYDYEVWSPGTSTWLEVSSVSNFKDFQARRASLKYRPSINEKPEYLHTLNGSALALPRCIIAILETYQQEDGSVIIPKVLRPYMGGLERISK